MPGAIGFALFQIGAPLALVNAVTLGFGAAAIRLGVGLGLQLIAGVIRRGQIPTPSPSDGQVAVKQALAPRIKYYGKVRVSGTVWWLDAISRVLYLGIAVNHGRIGAFLDWFIDSNQVEIDGTDKVTTSPYSAHDVYLHNRLGVATETKYSELLTGFGQDEVRGDGVASVLGTFENPSGGGSAAEFQNSYPNVPPTIRSTIEASVVWDPRENAQSRTDESTWEYSNNPVVCLLDYLRSADGYGIPWERISPNLAEWIAAADICDEPIDLLGGGTTPRYTIAGGYRLTDDPRDVVAKFESVMNGAVFTRRDGSIGISVGKFVEPTVTITSDQVLGYEGLMFGQDPVRSIAGIRAEDMSPDHDYREHEAEPWPTGDAVAALSDDRTAALDLLWVSSVSQARRLMKRAYLLATADWQGTVHLNAAGLRLLDERYFHLQIAELGIDRSFQIDAFCFDPSSLTCEVEVRSVDSSIDDWDTSEEGEEEGGGFAIVDTGSKTGINLDPIADCGGAAGQTLIVCGASAVGTVASPTGFTAIGRAGPTSSWAVGSWYRVLDGTESSTSFLTTSGNLEWMLLSGAPAPTIGTAPFQGIAQVSTGTPQADMPLPAAPVLLVVFGAGNSNFDPTGYLEIDDLDLPAVLTPDVEEILQTAGGSLDLMAILYRSDSTPPSNIEGFITSDHGVNGLICFSLTPGS